VRFPPHVLALVAVTACSFHGTHLPRRNHNTGDIECTDDIGVPIFDMIAGLAVIGFAAYVYQDLHEDPNSRDDAIKVAGPILFLSGLAFGSAYYGFKNVPRCRKARAQERENIAILRQRRRELKAARGTAWAVTQRAAAAARAGDCETVKSLDGAVRTIDEEFHRVVFLADVAISRCLMPPSAVPQ
jgi:hypothetical protein